MIPPTGDGLVVQGITGRQGSFWTERMLACGTPVVAGISPGRGGLQVGGVPVYDTVAEAVSRHPAGTAVLFTPPLSTKAAALEALAAGLSRLVLLAEFVPVQDTLWILAEAAERGSQVLGPNTAGLVVPGWGSAGIMPAFNPSIFRAGTVAVISRSGSLGTLICLNVVRAGFGQSAFIGLGGDSIVGTTARQALEEVEVDDRTNAVILVGEVGGAMEEEAATFVAEMTKPVVAFVAGRSAPPGRRMGHAGALAAGGKGEAEGKVVALRRAGADVVDTPSGIGPALARCLSPAPSS